MEGTATDQRDSLSRWYAKPYYWTMEVNTNGDVKI